MPRRHVGRLLAAAAALLAFLTVLSSVIRNDAFQGDVVLRYFTTSAVLDGLLLTLWLTAAVMVLGFALGTALAVMRLSANPVLRTPSWGYVWIFRSTPLLVQLLFWLNVGALYPTFGLGIPYGPQLVTEPRVGHGRSAVVGAGRRGTTRSRRRRGESEPPSAATGGHDAASVVSSGRKRSSIGSPNTAAILNASGKLGS
ncbi:ABC transporter permease subunit [Streptomyces sp. MS2.AVA.5]|uniref:ABC transporter permease subunit n=1 Tax=Streptomyces achmelvichensis TaxID=3134111 RepID=A0ACC6PMU8_9ACTN